MAGELGLGTAKIAGTVAVSDVATVGAATAGALGTTYHSSNIIGTATGTNPVESYIYNGDTESFRKDTALLDNINMTSSAYGMIGAGSKPGEEAVENFGERYDWGSESGRYSTQISPEMEKKILEGQRKRPVKNEVIGGHSPQINNSNDLFAVEELSVNADGTRNIKFVKDLQDGSISKIKKSTVFPDSWSDSKIIDTIKEVGDSPSISVRGRDGATWHRKIVDGVEVDVIKLGNDVISGYPTGKINAPKPSGF